MLLPRPRTDYNKFLPHVMANVTGDSRAGLPPNVALSYIRSAAIEFAKKSGILRRTERIMLQDGLQRYPLVDAPEEERVYRLSSVKRNGCDYPATFDDSTVIFECPIGVTQECPEYIEVKYVVIPERSSCGVDELIFDEWHDAIVDGALEQIHLMPQKPWTSGGASQQRGLKFRMAAGDARRKYFTDRAGTVPARVPRNFRY